MICELEVSDSSSDSVIISGPIPDYPELKRRKPNSAPRDRRRKDDDDDDDEGDIPLDEKVEKIQELEDLVNASASIPIGSDHLGDGDADAGNWSGSDTRSLKGGKSRNSAGKYLKKIKTLQQNKRRQETRISRLTKEVRTLRDKNSVQAAYIDVLCGMLGDDMKEKFRDRQGLGILGNVKADDEDQIGCEDRNGDGAGAWCPEEGGARNQREESEMKAKEKEFYCVEELDNLPSTSSRVAMIDGIEELPIEAVRERRLEKDENGDANLEGVFHATDPLEDGEENSIKSEEIGEDRKEHGKDESIVKGGEEGEIVEAEGPVVEEPQEYGSVPENQNPAVERQVTSDELRNAEVSNDGYKDSQIVRGEYHKDAHVACDEYISGDEYPIGACHEYDAVPISEDGRHRYDRVPGTGTSGKELAEAPGNGNARQVPEYGIADSQSCIFHYSSCGNHTLPVPESLPDHLNLQELLENGNHFLNFKDTEETGTSLIQDYKVDGEAEDVGDGMESVEPASLTNTTQDVERKIAPYDQKPTPSTSGLC